MCLFPIDSSLNSATPEFYIDLLMELARQDTKSDYSIQALKASEDKRARSLVTLLKSARVNSQETSQKTTNIKLAQSPTIKEIQLEMSA